MKNVIVIGASGSLAKYVIEAMKEVKNLRLSLFIRNKSRLSKDTVAGCEVIGGDAMNYNDVKKAVAGKDIVYVNLAGNLEAMARIL